MSVSNNANTFESVLRDMSRGMGQNSCSIFGEASRKPPETFDPTITIISNLLEIKWKK